MHDGSLVFNDAIAVTPSDTGTHNGVGFYIGGTGNIQVTTGAGNQVIFTALPVGAIINMRVQRIWATSTTATNIVLLKP